MKTPHHMLPAALFLMAALVGNAQAVYLNDANITVALGASMAPEPFNGLSTAQALANVIDAPSATAKEFHTQTTHVWFTGAAGLELDFDFGTEYDLTTLHFWNYWGEGFDVDNIAFTFFDAAGVQVGVLDVVDPFLGGYLETGPFTDNTPLSAQNYDLSFPTKVQSVNALLTGSNSQVDFNNLGFTGQLSICATEPTLPECLNGEEPEAPGADPRVPVPTPLALIGIGLAGIGYRRQRSKKAAS